MGQKVNPKSFRLGVTEDCDSIWYDFKSYSDKVYEDFVIRNFIKTELARAAVSNIQIKRKGTYVAIEGPQFSTYAESILYKSWNCDIIGMTNMPEVRLAREAEMGYASIGMVTDYDCWHKNHDAVTVDHVINIMHKNTKNVKILLLSMLENLNKIKKWNWNDKIYSCLNEAIITSQDSISSKTLKKLKPILKRRFSL